ncbi:ATP-grasp domain-containing protein, partial [Wenyingzhuangia sp. 1_MG-2023]|nr:ATP-grasp domain-containing protein [Wenyingzhuangia sp. 1_MG-2023]
FYAEVETIGLPCLIKPIMSSSGKGQSFVRTADELAAAWRYAQEGGRAGQGKVIVEGFVDFDFEITLLTIRHSDGAGGTLTSFCEPIGHRQQDGDYQESWQPQQMT